MSVARGGTDESELRSVHVIHAQLSKLNREISVPKSRHHQLNPFPSDGSTAGAHRDGWSNSPLNVSQHSVIANALYVSCFCQIERIHQKRLVSAATAASLHENTERN